MATDGLHSNKPWILTDVVTQVKPFESKTHMEADATVRKLIYHLNSNCPRFLCACVCMCVVVVVAVVGGLLFICVRYKTVLGETIQTDALFSSSSLRGLEESLFCHPTLRNAAAPAGPTTDGHSSGAWDAYWEHNEPLRDVDEVAIPVLSICAKDDPVRGDTQSTIPLELFETNPHFFLLLTDRGGHCGFSTQSAVRASRPHCASGPAAGPNNLPGSGGSGDTNWSHKAVLEFFRATTDFFAAEERTKQLAARRRGMGAVTGGGRVFRHRSVSTCKQRLPACSHNIHAIYSWQRSYTRWGTLWTLTRVL